MKELKLKNKIQFLILLTNIFEKEVVMFIFYLIFNILALKFGALNFQLFSFLVGTILQVTLKLKKIFSPWNNFIALLFFILGALLSTSQDSFFVGYFVFILLVSLISTIYELKVLKMSSSWLKHIFTFFYSIIVLASFPTLYFLFLKNKLGINLSDFLSNPDNFVVFSGYFIFYLIIIVNKQLLSFQNNLLKKYEDHS